MIEPGSCNSAYFQYYIMNKAYAVPKKMPFRNTF